MYVSLRKATEVETCESVVRGGIHFASSFYFCVTHVACGSMAVLHDAFTHNK